MAGSGVSAAAARQAMLGLLRPSSIGVGWWLAAVLMTSATNLGELLALPGRGGDARAVFAAAAIVRVVAVFYFTYALLRRLAGVTAPLRPGRPLLRFVPLALLAATLFGLVTAGGSRLLGGREMELASEWLAALALGVAWDLLTIRLVGWLPGLAAGAPFRALPTLFRGTSGAGVSLGLAYLQLVVPFAAIHLALSLIGGRLLLPDSALIALALVDGVVSAVQLLLTSALGIVAWRLATDGAGALRGQAGRG